MTDEPRFKVKKDSGSRYAYVIEAATGRRLASFNILKGDGWQYAVRYCETLNAMDVPAAPSTLAPHP